MSAVAVVLSVCVSSAIGAERNNPPMDETISRQTAEVSEGVVIAGLVDMAVLSRVYGDDVLVIDLRTEAEGTADEALAAAELGIEYLNIAVAGARVNPQQVEQLSEQLADSAMADQLVVIHCASGNRAAMLWGASQLRGGRSLESALATLEGVLTKQPAVDALTAYAGALESSEADAQP